MGRLAKTGIAILGLASLGGFVSLLGGPSLFSPFSNAISTILPESEVAVEKTEETKTQDKVPTPPKSEIPEKATEEVAAPKVTETPAPAPLLVSETKVQTPVIAPPISTPASSPTSKRRTPRASTSLSGGEKHAAPRRTQGTGSKGSGRWCLDPTQKPFMMTQGQVCGGWKLVGEKMVLS